MLTLTGNGHLTRGVELCTTRTGKHVATVSVASDRRDRQAGALYVDLILWEGQAEAAAEHLVKGQAVAFAGRFEPRTYTDRDGREHVAYELHDVMLEYGAKPRGLAALAAATGLRRCASALTHIGLGLLRAHRAAALSGP
jgi:single-strand DNA-binding protein